MSRQTIDYGIDLGTTNSAVALATGAGTEIIKNNLDGDTTPSAVYINRAGNLWVGQNARSKIADERAEEDVYTEFKRHMGTGHDYAFRSSGRHLRPEDLSAEVLKSLRGDIAQKRGEEIAAAVISVPAAFELHQCEATKRAAELAGLTTISLVQEPVAAALAFGHQKIDAKAYWLVFDFGGGTFDAALIRSEDGHLIVANHGGDNFLGGSDIDWAILEAILAPRVAKEFNLPDFKRGAAAHRHDMVRLKAAAELAKIDLSRKEKTFLEAQLHGIGSGGAAFETELTRADVARIAEPIILKAVAIAQRVIAEKRLAASAVERLIFVGGPTLAPYFREIIRAKLGIPADITMDPMTVVARGAALFAGGQKLPTKAAVGPAGARPGAAPGANGPLAVELLYKPVAADMEPIVGGRIQAAAGTSFAGYTIEAVNLRSKWRSGRVPVQEKGSFQLTGRAERGVQNVFTLELKDPGGAARAISPDRFTYTVGAVVDEQSLINSLGVATADNRLAVHFVKGQALPARSTKSYRTSLPLRRGESGSVLRIPITEGNRDLADRNVLVGSVEIRSDRIKRDLPAGSEVEVTLSMDVSRILTAVAYVPLLDEEFPARIELGGKVRQPDRTILREELGRETARLEALTAEAEGAEDPSSTVAARALAGSPLLAGLRRILDQADADFDGLLRAERDLIAFKIELDEIAERIAWPAAVLDCDRSLADLDALVTRQGSAEDKARAKTLRAQVAGIVAEKNGDRLRRKLSEIAEVYSALFYRQPAYWSDYFHSLEENRTAMRDPGRAEALFTQGRAHVASGNLAGLKEIVYQLQDLLPKAAVEDARRGYGSGLVV